MNIPRFTSEPLFDIVQQLQKLRQGTSPGKILCFEVLDPDLHAGAFGGVLQQINSITYLYRSHKAWMDLAEYLDCRYLTPEKTETPFLLIRYQILDTHKSWHQHEKPTEEKYGIDSGFSQIHKLEEPYFLLDFRDSLTQINLPEKARILNIGINRGDEFILFEKLFSSELYQAMEFVGIDHSPSAITLARQRFSNKNFSFLEEDINQWESWKIGTFDLLLSIGTLQSPGIDGKTIFQKMVKHFLKERGRVILGFPNVRYLDGEIKFGSKRKNFQKPELSLLINDLSFYKKHLQRRGFRVTITGKYYIFLAADRVR